MDTSAPPQKKQKLEQWKYYTNKFGDTVEDNNQWKNSKRVSKYANELNSMIPKELDEGVLSFDMNSYLQESEEDNPKIFVTRSAKSVWEFVFQYCEGKSKNHVVVTGNPGIGKSRSMAYLLQILLQNQKLVIYESRKDECFYAFVPQKNLDGTITYEGFTASIETFIKSSCAALKNPENYFLIDPDVSHPERVEVAHTIIASSPNKERTHEFMKTERALKYFIPTWTLSELEAIRTLMPVDQGYLSPKELNDRYTICGGIPRIVFSTKREFDIVKQSMIIGINRLQFDMIMRLVDSATVTGDQESKDRVPSLLFALKADANISECMCKYLQSTSISTVSSDFVAFSIMKKYYHDIMEILNPKTRKSSVSDSELGFFLEIIVHAWLSVGGTFDTRDLSSGSTSRLTIEEASKHVEAKRWDSLGKHLSNLPKVSSLQHSNRVLLTGNSNQPVFDAADAMDRVYQVTKSLTHPIKGMQLCRIFETYLKRKIKTMSEFHIYFVVPEYMYGEFKEQTITWEKVENFDPKMISHQDIKKVVKQHVLCLPTEPPADVIESVLKRMKDASKFIPQ